MEEKDPSEQFTGGTIHLLGVWKELKTLSLSCNLEKLGIQLQPPYVLDEILSQLATALDSSKELKTLGIDQELQNKLLNLVKATRSSLAQWDCQMEKFFEGMIYILQSYDARRTLHFMLMIDEKKEAGHKRISLEEYKFLTEYMESVLARGYEIFFFQAEVVSKQEKIEPLFLTRNS